MSTSTNILIAVVGFPSLIGYGLWLWWYLRPPSMKHILAVKIEAKEAFDVIRAEMLKRVPELKHMEGIQRIREIDRMFEGATLWGSWMSDASEERKGLTDSLRAAGYAIEHRYLKRID